MSLPGPRAPASRTDPLRHGEVAPGVLDRAVVRLRRAPDARVGLACFPFAGGDALAFRTWPAALGPSVEVYAVELPGRGLRLAERPHTRLAPLLDELACALGPLRERPLALFGHSMGALIAFELARRMEADGGPPPAHLFVAGSPPPEAPARTRLHDAPRGELVALLRALGGTPPEVYEHAELLDLFLPILRADLELLETRVHRPGPPLACGITALAGAHDAVARPAAAAEWAAYTRGPFDVRVLPGGHFFLRTAERELLDHLRVALEGPSARVSAAAAR